MNEILREQFDAVVMLTWSDWKSEPRSNRYHYATRFARDLPVLFVQPDGKDSEVTYERVEGTNINIIHAPANYGASQTTALIRELKKRRIFRPLLWIYNVFFEDFVERSNAILKIYHATEDYLSPPGDWAAGDDVVRAPLIRLLKSMDLVVAVSDGVAESYRENGDFGGKIVVLPNGCDFRFWNDSQAAHYEPKGGTEPVVLFQGGINERLDYELLTELAILLPEWQFWFCGDASRGGTGWANLVKFRNVKHLGRLTPEQIAEAARKSVIGLIPFKQDELIRRSLPLKAFEYAACGLPTVTVPIDALTQYPNIFSQVRTAGEFAAEIRRLAPTRTDSGALAERREVADKNSYDRRFTQLLEAISDTFEQNKGFEKLNVLILLADWNNDRREKCSYIRDLVNLSRNNTFLYCDALDDKEKIHLLSSVATDIYDCAVIPSSTITALSEDGLANLRQFLNSFLGFKIALVEQSHRSNTTLQNNIRELAIDADVPGPVVEVSSSYPCRSPTSFSGDFDRYLEKKLGTKASSPLVLAPALSCEQTVTAISVIGRNVSRNWSIGEFALCAKLTASTMREQGQELPPLAIADISATKVPKPSRLKAALRLLWRALPLTLRSRCGPHLYRFAVKLILGLKALFW